ncbi:acyl-CoA dehydrogenase family protein [Streptomyces pseudovenezuelae]|uniref:acyl-CoA dehydrogenase family protein n=1 Tax=Streptomyces pseudovenezuelae TaxID=67350 RepID=UPI003711FDEA
MTLIRSNAARADQEAILPPENLDALRDSGLMGLLVPQKYGGLEATMHDFAATARTLASACLSTAMVWTMHISQSDVVACWAGNELRENLLPRIAAGTEYLASVTTEGGRGSDLFTADTGVRHTAEHVEFSGRNAPVVTGGRHADGFLITLRAHNEAQPHEVSLVYASRDQLSLTESGAWNPMGMRGTESGGLEISGRVPLAQVVGEQGKFRDIARESMVPTSHIGWSACWLGAAEGAFRELLRWLRRPGRSGGPDLSSELLYERLGRIRVDLDLVSAYLHRVCDCVSAARVRGESLAAPKAQLRLNALKLAASELTFRTVDSMVQTAGMSNGYSRAAPLALERIFRDLRSARLNHSNDRMWPATGALALLDPSIDLL